MQNKIFHNILVTCLTLIVLLITFTGGTLVGFNFNQLTQNLNLPFLPAPSARAPSSSNNQLDKLFVPFWDSWRYIHEDYVDQPVNDVTLMRGAIKGMLDSLGDPHTAYMDPDEFRQDQTPLNGEYDGIGTINDTSGKYLTIISPIPGSPAEKAGLKAGDQITAVDKQDMTGIASELVINKILGKAGTPVTLTILRKGVTDPFDVTIVRAQILWPTVQGKMLDNNLAYIQMSSFGEKTDAEFRTALQPLLDKKPVGLILDLRYNGGGIVQTADQILSEFLPPDKVIMYEITKDNNPRSLQTSGKGIATQIPLVVLVNESTASASEITAGALQDYKRATLVGVNTYGKGSEQYWIPLTDDQGAIRITIAHWETPNKRQIDKIGLKPDIEVKMTDDDINNKKDPQLDAAVNFLLNNK